MALLDSGNRNKETRISPVSKRFTPLQQTQYHRFSQMPVHSSYLFTSSLFHQFFQLLLCALICIASPVHLAFHCQKAYWAISRNSHPPSLYTRLFSTNILYGSLFSFLCQSSHAGVASASHRIFFSMTFPDIISIYVRINITSCNFAIFALSARSFSFPAASYIAKFVPLAHI